MKAIGITSPARLAAIARRVFRAGPFLVRNLQHWRPYICPFEQMLPHVPARSHILDIGCGGGLWGALVAAVCKPARFVGFDSSRNAIAMAHANLARFDTLADGATRPEFLLLDVGAPWPEGTFDVVSIIDVVHHIPPRFQRSVLEQAAGVLAPGGVLIYKDMTARGWFRPAMNRLHDLALARQWIHYAPLDQVESWLTHIGLTLTRRDSFTRGWYGHELLVFRKPPV